MFDLNDPPIAIYFSLNPLFLLENCGDFGILNDCAVRKLFYCLDTCSIYTEAFTLMLELNLGFGLTILDFWFNAVLMRV